MESNRKKTDNGMESGTIQGLLGNGGLPNTRSALLGVNMIRSYNFGVYTWVWGVGIRTGAQ